MTGEGTIEARRPGARPDPASLHGEHGAVMKALPALGLREIGAAAAIVVLAAAVGGAAASQPTLALATIGAVYVLGIGALLAWKLSAPFSAASLLVVGGYIILPRGFAGVGVPLGGLPLLIGEISLLTLTPIAVLRLGWRVPAALIVPFVLWVAFNAVLTGRGFGSFGLDAVRDASLWYYVGFVLIGAATWQELGTETMRRWLAVPFAALLLTVPLTIVAAAEFLPPLNVPFADGPLLAERFDATAMHLIGSASLFLTARGLRRQPWPAWLGIGIAAGMLGLTALLQVRAAFVALAGAVMVLVIYRLVRPVAVIGVALLLALGVMWVLDVELPTGRGVVSARTVVERQVSTLMFFSDAEVDPREDDQAGTIEWRTIWWQALIEESLGDQTYLWIGRGYGADLREAVKTRAVGTLNWDQGEEEGKPVRSPHNVAVTVFARTGLIGLGLWLLVLTVCFATIARATLACRRRGDGDEELFGVWLIVYVLAMLLISLLGVVLEGPFGAAPFYWVLGVGLAWGRSQGKIVDEGRPEPHTPSTARNMTARYGQA